jgi:hypothetical protein
MTLLLRCLTLCLALPVALAADGPPPAATPPAPAQATPPTTPPAATAPATAPGPEPAKAPPALVQLDANRFKIGEIEFDKQTRAIRFPAILNQREGLLEYVLVGDKGKVHESLLRTAINATHLNIVLKLLRYQNSPELFGLRDEEGFPNGLFPAVDPKIKAAARAELRMIWKGEEKEQSATVNELITTQPEERTMPPGPWVYGGSVVYEGRFIAAETGDLIAIQTNEAAIFNYPGANRDNDEVWFPAAKLLPALGAEVTVEIRPWAPISKAKLPATKAKPKP